MGIPRHTPWYRVISRSPGKREAPEKNLPAHSHVPGRNSSGRDGKGYPHGQGKT
ncbi:hypothetical protein ASZ90_015851 [hydrocarbon metagenome]|uniref:Uncharacterized protein n=1 Tax=hydrocarbon metagenome TaxID=938273 RepID=A0A0W8F105_9ZZZZ